MLELLPQRLQLSEPGALHEARDFHRRGTHLPICRVARVGRVVHRVSTGERGKKIKKGK